jgi:predicted ArsR family transcriptional regulator
MGHNPGNPRSPLHDELFAGTRGQIIAALRRGRCTVDEIASDLSVTGNAVRSQLAMLQRDGLVRVVGMQRRSTRPAQLYDLTPELEHLLSRAYLPLLTHLIRLLAANESEAKFEATMRQAGHDIAREVASTLPAGPLNARVTQVSRILNQALGAATRVEKRDGAFVIRGNGCPLAALTGKHRGVCLAVESLVATLLDVPARECCDRDVKPRCCFEIASASPRPRATSPARSRR